jgi:hypothetical protein
MNAIKEYPRRWAMNAQATQEAKFTYETIERSEAKVFFAGGGAIVADGSDRRLFRQHRPARTRPRRARVEHAQ